MNCYTKGGAMNIFLAIVCLICGYSAGYWVDFQNRDPKYGFKRIIIDDKWRKLFHFRWISGQSVLLVAFLFEVVSLSIAILIALLSIVATLYNFNVIAQWVTIGLVLLEGYIFLCISCVIALIKIKHNLDNSKMGKKSFLCELETLFRVNTDVKRKVKVISCDNPEKMIYIIRCGKIFGRRFYAKSAQKYTPQLGEITYARYYAYITPHFVLTPSNKLK